MAAPVGDPWVRFREDRDEESRNRLVVQYAPLVKYVVGRLGVRLPEHVDQQDLVSEGVIGLMDAIDRFDPDREIRFESFAVPRIHGSIIDSLRSQDWLPRRVRTEIKKIEAARSELEGKLGATPTDEQLADYLGMTPGEVARLEAKKASARMSSLDELQSVNDTLPAEPEELQPDGAVLEAVRKLAERDQIVIALYYFEQLTLAEIGQVLGVTESRVSQLRSKATKALRDAMN
jgi:RNA polymerase sigma factor for flagellar operon FliA